MAKGDDIEERLVNFAVDVLKLCERISKSPEGSKIADQLSRSATSCAANYAEARAAESRGDFIHKLGLVLKELNESKVWLNVISRRNLVSPNGLSDLLEECIALSKIIAVSRRTAILNAGKTKKR
jgi:four helix bundle protein